MYEPVTHALVEDGQIATGDAVLDIGTGPGEPALTIAALVGPEGKVNGIDPVPAMVEAARREADRLGRSNAQFDVAFADDLPFPDDTFDAVVSRFGAMFFPSPADGVRELLRVLKPGRKLALAVWHFENRNPFSHLLSRILERYLGSPPLDEDAPEPTRFARPGKLRDVLQKAGASSPSERLLAFTIRASLSVEDFVAMRCEMNKKVPMLSAAQLTEVKRQALEAFREYSTDLGMNFPAEVLIVSGTKNGPTLRASDAQVPASMG
jgi:ubiquinone/menaquinone biosynthesis C-methylase UbiE